MKINHRLDLFLRTVLVPPQPQLLQQQVKKESKKQRGGLIGLFESVIADYLPGLSRRRRSSKVKIEKEEEECKLEGRSGEIMGEVLAATRDMLNLWIQLGSMDEEMDWCTQVIQAAGRGNWAR